MEQSDFITVKVKSMDEAVVEFRLSSKDKVLDLKNLIKDVSLAEKASLTHLLGTASTPQKTADCVHGSLDPG